MSYKLYLKVDNGHDEILAWSVENLLDSIILLRNCHIKDAIVDIWLFEYEEDLMAFKLRWE